MREHKPLLWALVGAVILAVYGVVAALQPISEFGRVYAAYGGIFIALSLAWGIIVDGFQPDKWDLLGAAICSGRGPIHPSSWKKRRILRSSRLQSPPAQPRSSSYRTTLRDLFGPQTGPW